MRGAWPHLGSVAAGHCRLAALTNYRGIISQELNDQAQGSSGQCGKATATKQQPKQSRGLLVPAFLTSPLSPCQWMHTYVMTPDHRHYDHFNLLVGEFSAGKVGQQEEDELCYFSNKEMPHCCTKLQKGCIYGICNDVLDTPWPKLQLGTYDFHFVK